MPDVAQSQKTQKPSLLEWVGMEKVVLPLQTQPGRSTPAQADLFVNLADPNAKGIHMSRLFLTLEEGFEQQLLTPQVVRQVLNTFVECQQGLADSARLVLRWEELFRRKALLSEHQGYKAYPFCLSAESVRGDLSLQLTFSVFYSSTCPCSSALSRQLFQQAFASSFKDRSLSYEEIYQWLGEKQIASPHSQRSQADITLSFNSNIQSFDFESYINCLEEALKTPVQTAVKREDEQEFARLNGQNPMFVEDALRIMKDALRTLPGVASFKVKTHHYESLHAHDAVGSIRSDL